MRSCNYECTIVCWCWLTGWNKDCGLLTKTSQRRDVMSDAGSHLSGLSEAQTESIIPTSNVPWRERDKVMVFRGWIMSFKHTQGRNLKMLDIDWVHIYTGSIPSLLKFWPITFWWRKTCAALMDLTCTASRQQVAICTFKQSRRRTVHKL